MKEARKKKIEDMRNRKIQDNEKIPPIPKLKRSRAVDLKQEIIKSSSIFLFLISFFLLLIFSRYLL